MAIESILQFEVKGLKNPVPIVGAYTRIIGFSGLADEIGQIKAQAPAPEITLRVKDWASKEGAQRVFVAERTGQEFETADDYSGPGQLISETRTRVADLAFDPKNPEHVEQWEAAGKPDPEELDAHGNPWKPTIYENYNVFHEEVEVYRGQTVEEPIQEREIKLPLEIAIMVVTHAVPGKNPQENYETLASELYRAAMLSGAFTDPKAA